MIFNSSLFRGIVKVECLSSVMISSFSIWKILNYSRLLSSIQLWHEQSLFLFKDNDFLQKDVRSKASKVLSYFLLWFRFSWGFVTNRKDDTHCEIGAVCAQCDSQHVCPESTISATAIGHKSNSGSSILHRYFYRLF